MSNFPFTIATTPPGTLKLVAGEKGTFAFTLTSMAAPDRSFELQLVPLWLGPDRKGIEADWLAAGPADTLRMAGGETATVSIIARPGATTPRGEQTLKLRVARKDDPNEAYLDSPPVICEVLASPLTPPPPPRKRWLIPVLVAGAVVLAGAGVGIWLLTRPPPPPPPACAAGAQRCAADGKSLETCDAAGTWTIAPCDDGHCDPATSACVKDPKGDCTPGALRCTTDGKSLETCDPPGTWKTAQCPSSTPLCKDNKCQCVANADQQCGQCGGKILCDGSCSKPNPPGFDTSCGCGGKIQCDGSCSKPNHADTGKSCGCGGTTRCDGSCSKPSHPDTGKTCGCGGTVQCDGSCSRPSHPDTGKDCGCGGKVQCDGSCNKPNHPNTGKPCGECGGQTLCDGRCSNTTPRCPPGFVVDTGGFCRSAGETENYNANHSFGGVWPGDRCDPCGGPLDTNKTISLTCGPGRVRSSFSAGRVGGPKPGECSGQWANPGDPNDCSLRVHIKTAFLDNFLCGIVIRSVERRRQCTP